MLSRTGTGATETTKTQPPWTLQMLTCLICLPCHSSHKFLKLLLCVEL